jgi:hypothetical protein
VRLGLLNLGMTHPDSVCLRIGSLFLESGLHNDIDFPLVAPVRTHCPEGLSLGPFAPLLGSGKLFEMTRQYEGKRANAHLVQLAAVCVIERLQLEDPSPWILAPHAAGCSGRLKNERENWEV